MHPLLEKRAQTVLIVDKNNTYAAALRAYLPTESTVVVVSKETIVTDLPVVSLPFSAFPQIPNALYDAIVFFSAEKSDAHLLEPLAKKADSEHVPFFVVFANEAEEEGEKELQHLTYPVIQIVVGDIFGGNEETPLTTFLKHAKKTRKVKLLSMGLSLWYPVLYEDVVKKLAELIAGNSTKRNVFLGPAHPLTELTLAHALQKIDPLLSLDFVSGGERKREKEINQSVMPDYDSQKAIQTYFANLPLVLTKEEEKETSVFFTSPTKKKKSSKLFYCIYVVLALFFIPLLSVILATGVGLLLLKTGVDDVSSGNIPSALAKVNAANTYLSLAEISSGILLQEGTVLGLSGPLTTVQKEVHLSVGVGQFVQTTVITWENLSEILAGKTLTPQDNVNTVTAEIKQLSGLLGQITAQDIPQQFRDTYFNVSYVVSLLGNVADEMPTILGVTGERTYLVIFQNNMELRPGGGFIGSYGILHLKNGKIEDFSIHNVYDADGQLKGHIEPPFAIRRYIPSVHLYLRDSNFDPDFPTNAQKAAALLFDETGEKVDGVVGIDLNVLSALLASEGSVYVPTYNQTVTKDNFFQLIEQHAEKNSFPGSTQKQDFLNAFSQALFQKLQHPAHLSLTTLLSQAVMLLNQKDSMVSFEDPLTQSAVGLSGLSNSLTDSRASTSGTLTDFLGVVEANIGVNKVNAFVTRSLTHEVTIDNAGAVTETASLTLNNNSDGSWPGGGYKNYLRFMVPVGSSLQKVLINNVEQTIVPAVTDPSLYEAPSFTAPKGLEVAKEEEQGKVFYGFLVIVPVKSTMTITISYTLPNQLPLQNLNPQYNVLVWKQPGVDPYPYTLNLQLPNTSSVLTSSIHLAADNSYQTILGKDTDMHFSLTTK